MWWRRVARVKRYLWLILSVVWLTGGAGRDLARPVGATSPAPHAALLVLTHDSPVNGAIWNQTETLILTWDTAAHVWDAESGSRLLDMRHQGQPRILGAAWNRSETRILTWANDGTARLWDAVTGSQVLLLAHTISSEVKGAMWTSDESRILTWGNDNTARLWDSQTGAELTRYSHYGPVNGALWSAAQTHLLTWSADGYAMLWQDNALVQQFQHDFGVIGAAWSSDGMRLLTWGNDGRAKVWEVATGNLLQSLIHPAIWGAQWTTGGVLTWGLDGTARHWDNTGGLVQQVAVDSLLWGITPDASGVWLRSSNGTVSYWQGDSITQTLPNAERVRTVERYQDSLLVAAGVGVTLWDIPSSTPLAQYDHADTIRGAIWNQDGSRILSWSSDRTARVWLVLGPDDCWISAPANANQRAAPSTTAEQRGTLAANSGRLGIGRALDATGYTWWQLDNGNWIREDVVEAAEACSELPLAEN